MRLSDKTQFVGTEYLYPFRDAIPGPDETVKEVIELPDVEHAIDEKIDRIRDLEAEQRAIARLAGAYPGQGPIAAVLKLVEEVEHYRELREEGPVVDDQAAEIKILEGVPTSMPEPGLWEAKGELWRDDLDHPIAIAIRHPGIQGLVFVTDEAWELHRDAGRHET